jgi:hypothetical protein
VSQKLVTAVLAEAKKMSLRLSLGQNARDDAVEKPSAQKLTLQAGFELVFDPMRGKFHNPSARHVSNVKSLAAQVLSQRLFPTHWADFKPADFMECWRRLAHLHKSNGKVSGPRHAEMLTDAVISAGKWLVANEHLPADTFLGSEGWRKELKSVFASIAKTPAKNRKPPRHTQDEIGRMFRAISDPRLVLFQRLRPLLITHQREEALANARRSALTLKGMRGTLELAWIRLSRSGPELQQSQSLELPESAVGLLTHAVKEGHLRQLEEAYVEHGIDYYIFPLSLKVIDSASPAPLTATKPNLLDLDPRLCLGLELGGELRLGQVQETTRSLLSLTPSEYAPHGAFEVIGNDIKRGEYVFFNKEQRAAVDHALATYLSLFEKSYREDDRATDYALFPSGKLSRGIALPPTASRGTARSRTGKVLTRDALLKQFRVLEKVCGIEVLKNRGWYGIRRGMTDIVPRFTTDVREQDAAGGWTPGSSTRRTVYQDGQDPLVRASLAQKREAIRGRAPAQAAEAAQAAAAAINCVDDTGVLALFEKLGPDQRRALAMLLKGAE